jgi:hypothetical protein
MAGRTGLPVSNVAMPLGNPSTSAKDVAMRLTRGASQRLARPRRAFCSWSSVGNPSRDAASTVGTEG